MTKRPIVTFVDDDGKAEVYTKLYPIFKEKKIPFSAAIITGRLDTPDHMTKEQVRHLILDGHEMLGHTHHAHSPNMTAYPTEYLKKDTLNCKESLEALGSSSKGFVYPQGRSTIRIRQIVKRNFEFAFGATGVNGNKNVEKMLLKRLGFGMWGSGDQLAVYKKQIDDLVAEGGWLTYMIHTGIGPTATEELARLPELIDYIQSKEIDIVTASEGYELYGSGKKKSLFLKSKELIKEFIRELFLVTNDHIKKVLKK